MTSGPGWRAAWDRTTRLLPWAVDAAVVAGVALVALVDAVAASGIGPVGPTALAGVVAVVLAAGRRWAPLPAFVLLVLEVVVVAAAVPLSDARYGPLAPACALAALAAPVVRRQPAPVAAAAGAIGGLAVLAATATWSTDPATRVLLVALLGGAYGTGVVAGLYLRHLDDLQVRATEAARRAERLDLARELHDLVAHYVTGIVVQAQAAQVVAAHDPAAATATLGRIEEAGRDALVAMRGMVGTLRGPDGAAGAAAPTLPPIGLAAPDLGGLDDLAARSRTAGLPVAVAVSPAAAAAVHGATAGSVHRIVQESLTNVHRHAVDASGARVDVDVVDHRLVVTVTDDGHPPAVGADDRALVGAGFGLVGMAERAEALAGTLAAGPLDPPHRGWRVRAVLPLDPEVAP